MNHWPYIVASYLIVLGAAGILAAVSLAAMRRAERRAEALKDKR